MSRRCELTAKGPQVGHKVSHSNIKTKRRFLPNLLNVTMISDALGRQVKLRVSANALKTVDHRGGLDSYLLSAKDDVLASGWARNLYLNRTYAWSAACEQKLKALTRRPLKASSACRKKPTWSRTPSSRCGRRSRCGDG